MSHRRWKWQLLALCAIPLIFWGIATLPETRWVGSTDLNILFQIAEDETGQVIPGALVEVRQEKGGFCWMCLNMLERWNASNRALRD